MFIKQMWDKQMIVTNTKNTTFFEMMVLEGCLFSTFEQAQLVYGPLED